MTLCCWWPRSKFELKCCRCGLCAKLANDIVCLVIGLRSARRGSVFLNKNTVMRSQSRSLCLHLYHTLLPLPIFNYLIVPAFVGLALCSCQGNAGVYFPKESHHPRLSTRAGDATDSSTRPKMQKSTHRSTNSKSIGS